MFRRKAGSKKAVRDWEAELEDAGNSTSSAQTEVSDAYLKLKEELEERERSQRERKLEEDNKEESGREERRTDPAPVPPRNPRVYFDISVSPPGSSYTAKGEHIGRLEFELFAGVVPITAENFRALCTGEKGSARAGRLCYSGNIFHRIVSGFMAQGGDITREDGSGGQSIYGATFSDENFKLRHDKRGLLSMANSGKHSNNSQFFLTFGPASWLDRKHVVFGKMVRGEQVLRQIEARGSKTGEVSGRVEITASGELDDSDEDEDEVGGGGGGQGHGGRGRRGGGGTVEGGGREDMTTMTRVVGGGETKVTVVAIESVEGAQMVVGVEAGGAGAGAGAEITRGGGVVGAGTGAEPEVEAGVEALVDAAGKETEDLVGDGSNSKSPPELVAYATTTTHNTKSGDLVYRTTADDEQQEVNEKRSE